MDFLSDNNNIILETVLPLLGGLKKFASADDISAAELAEQAKSSMQEQAAAYPPTLFIKQSSREYPCSNRIETAISYAYATHAENGDESVQAPLRKVAASFGITDLLGKIDELFEPDSGAEELSKSASASEGIYALEIGDKKNYPAGNRVEISESADKLARDLSRMPVLHSKIAARNLVKRAAEEGLPVDTTVFTAGVLKRAEQRIPTPDGMEFVKKQRKDYYDAKALSVLDEILTKVASTPVYEVGDAEKLVAQIEKLDAASGIKYNASGRILDPYSVIFRGPTVDMVKRAADQMVRVSPKGGETQIVHISRVQEAASAAPPADFLSEEVGDFLRKLASTDSAPVANTILATADEASVKMLAKLLGGKG